MKGGREREQEREKGREERKGSVKVRCVGGGVGLTEEEWAMDGGGKGRW
ncbi:hypothetical protein [Escherichia coli]|nr:hypothetical protein [Escherichia coli]